MNRRGFLGAILAAAAAPAFVRAAMPVKPIGDGILVGVDYGTDDHGAIVMGTWQADGSMLIDNVIPLYRGEVGCLDGVPIIGDPEAIRHWSEALYAQISRRPALLDRIEAGGIIAPPIDWRRELG